MYVCFCHISKFTAGWMRLLRPPSLHSCNPVKLYIVFIALFVQTTNNSTHKCNFLSSVVDNFQKMICFRIKGYLFCPFVIQPWTKNRTTSFTVHWTCCAVATSTLLQCAHVSIRHFSYWPVNTVCGPMENIAWVAKTFCDTSSGRDLRTWISSVEKLWVSSAVQKGLNCLKRCASMH